MIHVQSRRRHGLAVATALGLAALAVAAPAQADPPGNNGTVKIAPHGEVDGIPQNTPHVGCVFDVEWYGFDEGDDIVSEVTFESWAPTAVPMTVDGPAEVFVGADPASGAGTGSDEQGADADNGFDGEATYTLAFDGEPHPQQGYHVKLTIHTPGSQGADTKHKVFWVEDCGTESAPEEESPEQPENPEQPSTPEQPETPEQPGSPEQPEAPEQPEVAGEQAEGPQHGSQVEVRGEQAVAPEVSAGEAVEREVAPTAVDAGVAGPGVASTALAAATSWLGALVALAGALLVGAALLVRRARS